MSLPRTTFTALLLISLAACGGGGDDDGPGPGNFPDAGGGGPTPDAGLPQLCAELQAPAGTISSYPGTFSGATVGGGADLSNPEGVCGEGQGEWFAEVGEDVVVALTNLTPGAPYAVTVDSEEDVGVYVITACQPLNAGPVAGECLGYADLTATGEQVGFAAPDDGVAWVVVDSAELDGAPPTGAFEMQVALVECASGFDCTSADEPYCASDFSCTAGFGECTGDDAVEASAGGDDGPAAATELDAPTKDAPTVYTAAACSLPATEEDWYKVTLTGNDGLSVTLEPGAEADFDVIAFDSEGGLVGFGVNSGPVEEQLVLDVPAGTYYFLVYLYDPADSAAALPYTLTLTAPECETSFDCADPSEPVCDEAAACVAGPSQCVGDDNGDIGGDDGPAGARSLSGGVNKKVTRIGKICSVPATEVDYYYFVVSDGQGMDLSLAWDTAEWDLDLEVAGPTNVMHGVSYWVNPEEVSLTYLPAGTYYAKVTLYAPADDTAVKRYTISGTKRAAQMCTGAADCAAVYSNQLYRGDCLGNGTCDFLTSTGAADGSPCDSGDNCTSGGCSYIPFEADAQDSVCTNVCTTDADCAAVGAGLTCTTGLGTNFCVPACTSDLECGADTTSGTLDADQPWDYITCDEGTGACTF